MRRLSALALGLILAVVWAPAVWAQAGNSEEPALVGRITFIDGQLLRYVYDEQDWVATVRDAPFGLEDAVYSGDTGKAEFKLPNGVWVRTGSDTQIQLIVLRDDLTEIDVASGTVRFYNKSQKALIKATTPFGYVLARPGASFDLYVGDDSAEVISIDGAVDFVLGEGESRYAVEAGGASIISDGRVAVEGDGQVDAAWDEWNLKREELWTKGCKSRESQSITCPMSCATMLTVSTKTAGGSRFTMKAGTGSCGARRGLLQAGSHSRLAGGRCGTRIMYGFPGNLSAM